MKFMKNCLALAAACAALSLPLMAHHGTGASYDQKDALGFINLIGLPMQVRASIKGLGKGAKKAKRK